MGGIEFSPLLDYIFNILPYPANLPTSTYNLLGLVERLDTMGKRQFTSQASSARAANASAGFGLGFSTTSTRLSYLTEPSNLSSISDANVVVSFKNLSKKDGTTKSKALEDLRTFIQTQPNEQGGAEEAILEAWVR